MKINLYLSSIEKEYNNLQKVKKCTDDKEIIEMIDNYILQMKPYIEDINKIKDNIIYKFKKNPDFKEAYLMQHATFGYYMLDVIFNDNIVNYSKTEIDFQDIVAKYNNKYNDSINSILHLHKDYDFEELEDYDYLKLD